MENCFSGNSDFGTISLSCYLVWQQVRIKEENIKQDIGSASYQRNYRRVVSGSAAELIVDWCANKALFYLSSFAKATEDRTAKEIVFQ